MLLPSRTTYQKSEYAKADGTHDTPTKPYYTTITREQLEEPSRLPWTLCSWTSQISNMAFHVGRHKRHVTTGSYAWLL